MIVDIFLMLALSMFDRQRGNPTRGYPKALALMTIGMVAALLMQLGSTTGAIFVAMAVAIGYSIGWGQPLGAALRGTPSDDYEWWQFCQPLRSYPYLALAVRGAIVGVLVALGGDFSAALVIGVACAIAFPLAPAITVYGLRQVYDRGWATQEYIRGGLFGLLIVLLR